MKTEKPRNPPEPVRGEKVELVGGPLCGLEMDWPSSHPTMKMNYYGGTCWYQYEGRGKAFYVRG